jgi:hypothetical protein
VATTEKTKASQLVLGKAKGKPVRFSHLHVHVPHLNTESNKREYSVQIWIPKENVEDKATLDAAYAEQLEAYTKLEGKPGKEWHNPIKDGDKIEDKKGNARPVPGCWVIGAKSAGYDDEGAVRNPPAVVGTERGLDGELKPLTSSQIKSGDWGRVSINLKFFTKGRTGVGVYLNSLQKVKDGEALGGGRKSATEEFGDFDDEDEDLLS